MKREELNKKVLEHLARYFNDELDLAAIEDNLPDELNQWDASDVAQAIIYCGDNPEGVYDMLEDRDVHVNSLSNDRGRAISEWAHGSISILAHEIMTEIITGVRHAIYEEDWKQDPYANWFMEALRRQMLRAIDTWDPSETPNAKLYRERVTKATTVGELINILYYDWSLHNDISMLTEVMNEACQQRDL